MHCILENDFIPFAKRCTCCSCGSAVKNETFPERNQKALKKEQIKNRFRWSTLDNAAKVFPALAGKRDSRVFRFACQLKEKIDAQMLQIALDQTLEEFPTFTNIIRHGMFWYYLEESELRPVVHEEDTVVCRNLYDKNDHRLLIDVSYYQNRINLEVFHAIADGTGALMFLRTLVVRYLLLVHPRELAGYDLSLGIDSTFKEKKSDSFSQYYEKQEAAGGHKMSFLGEKTASVYCFQETETPDCRQHVTEGNISAKAILAEAKKHGTTVTVFLTAVLIQAIYDSMEPRDRKKAVSVMIPVNLRSYFESNTVRNFFGLIPVVYDRKKDGEAMEDIIASVGTTFRKTLTKERLEQMLNDQVSLEKHVYTRMAPLFIKDIAMHISSYIASRRQTIYFSNLGRITLPQAAAGYVELFDVFISSAGKQVCMCSYGDRMVITFAGVILPKDVECAFFRRLSQYDPEMIVSANYSGGGANRGW